MISVGVFFITGDGVAGLKERNTRDGQCGVSVRVGVLTGSAVSGAAAGR